VSVIPRKSLGQNFLKDRNIIKKIITSFATEPQDDVLEIGPGMGALTEYLVTSCKHLTAVEFDERAVLYLDERFPKEDYPNLDLLHLDFLDFNFITGQRLKVIGNIPYNISSEILFHLIENREYIEKVQLMVQKEVAQRLVSPINKKTYGITTVAVNLVGDCKKLFDVPPECFYPKPRVMSSVIELNFSKNISDTLYSNTMSIVRTAFNQRRKQLRNSLKNLLQEGIGERTSDFIKYMDEKKSNIFNKRPENLSYNDFIEMYKEILSFE